MNQKQKLTKNVHISPDTVTQLQALLGLFLKKQKKTTHKRKQKQKQKPSAWQNVLSSLPVSYFKNKCLKIYFVN